MRICQLELFNFRGIKEGKMILPDHSILIGPNNAGKSTVAEAFALLCGRERTLRALCDWDFYGGDPKPETRFKIIATITDFGDNNPENYPLWFVGENTARPIWWDKETTTVSYEPDEPKGFKLAAQIAIAGRYDDLESDFETIRFFYDGDCDPFTDDHRKVSSKHLRDLGLFLLPSNREWDQLFSFGSSTFLKLLTEYGAVPGRHIDDLKKELRNPRSKVEEAELFSDIIKRAEKELQSFSLMSDVAKLVYRPTSLDTLSVLRSLIPHIFHSSELLLPLSRQGSGTVSLQGFLILLAFGEHRSEEGKNFILVAEEPELHLHPSLHNRLVQRIRSVSTQSVITTQSPIIASVYQPNEVFFVRNSKNIFSSHPLRTKPIASISSNVIKKLYLQFRREYYEALLGGVIIIPEGIHDYGWLQLWQRIIETSAGVGGTLATFIPTQDSSVRETFLEVYQFRTDVLPLVDGDTDGNRYLSELVSLPTPPKRIVQYGKNASTEYLSAWILEPMLSSPQGTLLNLLPHVTNPKLEDLQKNLVASNNKKDRELRENLAWEALDNAECVNRAREFFNDISMIALGKSPTNNSWNVEKKTDSVEVFVAQHIQKI
jgi:putative ATP-dependent endonuclease of OLD family